MIQHKPPSSTFQIQPNRQPRNGVLNGKKAAPPVGAPRAIQPRSGAQVAQADPYFIWAQTSGARRLERILVEKQSLLQIAVELHGGDGAARQQVFEALKFAGMIPRQAYWEESIGGPVIEPFFTALVHERRLAGFARAAARRYGLVTVRFELGHPALQRGVVSTTSYGVKEADERDEDVKKDKPLTGKVIAVIDYGCPFAHAAFLDANQHSRVRYVWLQGKSSISPGAKYDLPKVKSLIDGENELFPYGRELRASLIDRVLAENCPPSGKPNESACYEAIGYDLMREATTHGAHVLSIAAGGLNPLNDSADKASEAEIIFVQLPRAAVADASGGSMNCYVIDALRYIQERADSSADVVVNMSFGTHAGPHDGTSLLERAIDHLIKRRGETKFKVVIPAGNSFNAACHARVSLEPGERKELNWQVMPDDPTDTFLEIWYGGEGGDADQALVEIQEPFSNDWLGPVKLNQLASWYGDRATGKGKCNEPACTIVHTECSHNNRVALIALAPTRNDELDQAEARYGVWKIRITNKGKKELLADAWIERDDPILDLGGSSRQSRFVVTHQDDTELDYPTGGLVTKFCTLNSYATAEYVHAVGAAVMPTLRASSFYGASGVLPARYSSAGPGRGAKYGAINWVAYSEESDVLPGINAAGTRSRYWVRRDGTSVAAPQVARALMNAMCAGARRVWPLVASKLPIGADTRPKLQQRRISADSKLVQW